MRWIARASIGVGVLWLVMSFTYPFGWDQGLFAWAGGVIVHGGMPYVDAWDMKGPLIYYIYALAEMVFGVHLWSIRIVDAALLVAATIAIARAASALTDAVIGRWAALVFFLWYASHSYWHTAQPDGWTGMLLIVALAPLLSSAENGALGVGRAIWIGVCVGLATLFKPLWITFLLVPIAHMAMTQRSRRVVLSLCVVAGWAAPVIAAIGWFASRGALDELVAVHLRYAALYAGLSSGDRLRGLVDYVLASRVMAVALPVVLYGAIVLWQKRRAAAVMLVAWSALVVVAVTLQNRFFAYHWLPILPAATLLGAVGLYEVRARLPQLATVFSLILLAHCLAPIVFEEARFASWVAGRTSTDAYYDAYGGPGDDMKAVRWLRESGRPGDVYVFGWQGAVAWLSERRIVSRFGFSMPLLIGEGLEIRDRYRRELLAALSSTPPRYILVGPQAERILGARLTVADFPELADLISRGYREAARFGQITIYEIAP